MKGHSCLFAIAFAVAGLFFVLPAFAARAGTGAHVAQPAHPRQTPAIVEAGPPGHRIDAALQEAPAAVAGAPGHFIRPVPPSRPAVVEAGPPGHRTAPAR